MKLQLQNLRIAAGYKTRKSFSEACGFPERQIKAWEDGERHLRIEQAAEIADFLGCSLDELAGRWEYVGRFADQRQNGMNDDYMMLSESGKESAANAVYGIRMGEAGFSNNTNKGVQGGKVERSA